MGNEQEFGCCESWPIELTAMSSMLTNTSDAMFLTPVSSTSWSIPREISQ
jgi:hypothetical protein